MTQLVGILLAGGVGRRFDASGQRHKLLATLADGQSVLAASAQHLRAVLAEVIVVIRPGPHAPALAQIAAAADCQPLLCPQSQQGMGHSIAAGVAARETAKGWLILPADMPWVAPAVIQQVCSALNAGADIAAPFYQGSRGHPVGFAAPCKSALLALTGDRGAQALMQQFMVQRIKVDTRDVLRDVDVDGDLVG